MNQTTQIYVNDTLVYVHSDDTDDQAKHDATAKAITKTIEWFKKYYPDIIADMEVYRGSLTDMRSDYPGNNSPGIKIGDLDPALDQIIDAIRDAVKMASSSSNSEDTTHRTPKSVEERPAHEEFEEVLHPHYDYYEATEHMHTEKPCDPDEQ